MEGSTTSSLRRLRDEMRAVTAPCVAAPVAPRRANRGVLITCAATACVLACAALVAHKRLFAVPRRAPDDDCDDPLFQRL